MIFPPDLTGANFYWSLALQWTCVIRRKGDRHVAGRGPTPEAALASALAGGIYQSEPTYAIPRGLNIDIDL